MTLFFSFLLGICVGSFLNVIIDRLPLGQSIIKPPSHCPSCQRRLGILDLIPIFSYLALRGRCRYCGIAIPRRILAVELGIGLLFIFLCWRYGFNVQFLILAIYTSLFIVLAVIDLEHGLILNRLVYPAIVVTLILSPFWGELGFPRSFLGNTMIGIFLNSLIAGGIALFIFLLPILVYRGSMGWGDVKMAALVGLVVGFPSVLAAIGVTVLSGGLVAGVLLLLHLKGRKEAIPFGPYLSLGAVVALLWGEALCDWYMGLF